MKALKDIAFFWSILESVAACSFESKSGYDDEVGEMIKRLLREFVQPFKELHISVTSLPVSAIFSISISFHWQQDFSSS